MIGKRGLKRIEKMHLEFFGDSYDLVKRFLIECLDPNGDWGIVPMFTDKWSDDQIAAYEQLLGGRVLRPDYIKGTRNRQQVISAGDWAGHVFFDPDTGIQYPDSNTGPTTHVRLNELVREARNRPQYLTLVFDQSYANAKLPAKTRTMRRKLVHLKGKGVEGFGYLGQASFLILSQAQDAIAQARQNLRDAGVPDSRLIN